MSTEDHARAEALLAQIKSERGKVPRRYPAVARRDAVALELYHRNFMHVMHEKKALPLKFKELILVTTNAVVHHDAGVRAHMRSAFEAGASEDEVAEAIQVAGVVGGIHVVLLGHEVLEELKGGDAKASG